MTTTNTTKKSNPKTGFGFSYLLGVTIVIGALLLLAVFSIKPALFQARSLSPLQIPSTFSGNMYMVVQRWDGEDNVLVLDSELNQLVNNFEAGYNTSVKLTANQRILYIYTQATSKDDTWRGSISAIETSSNDLLWQLDIPGAPFVGSPVTGAWLSADEKYLYLQGSPDNFTPHIFVVDTQLGTLLHDFELPLPYPSNVDMAFPQAWKLPWAETLLVASRNQLFTFDLTSGETGNTLSLFDPESIKNVPHNLPYTAFVWSGAVDPARRRLFLATSTQQILMVDLNEQPFVTTSVVSLPAGWQFTVMQPILYFSEDKDVYIQVKRDKTTITNGLEVEEVWVYDTNTWTRSSRLNLPQQLLNTPNNSASDGLDLTNYGLALSLDRQSVYSLSRKGLVQIGEDTNGRLQGTWFNAPGEEANTYVRKFLVP
jgi:hypothetical protein